MIVPRSIASIGLGFGSYAEATLGFITQVADITQFWGGAGNYREYRTKRPKAREVKKLVQEVARDIVPTHRPIPAITKELDMDRVIALIQYEGKKIAQQFIRQAIERKLQQEQEDEDMLLLMML
jgi:hypothetical protein